MDAASVAANPPNPAAYEGVAAGLRSLEAHVLDQWRAALQTADDAGIARCVQLGNAIRAIERTMQTEAGFGWIAAFDPFRPPVG